MFKSLQILSTSLVNHNDMQRLEIIYNAPYTCHLTLDVLVEDKKIASAMDLPITSGKCNAFIFVPVVNKDLDARFNFYDLDGNLIYSTIQTIKAPRDWTFYFMISSHTDIGLHNSQYVQRANSEKFIQDAISLSEQTKNDCFDERYKYVMEGTWFWNNFPQDKGNKKAKDVVENYVKKGLLGICCGVAGNVMQAFGLEELCRFSYERKKLEEEWGVKCQTMTMIDNNGLSASIIQPLVDAGYKNVIFSPNQWHPKNSTVWNRNLLDDTYPWNPNAGGKGSRIDFRYDTNLPMTFFWENEKGERLLIAGSTQYDNSGAPFGIFNKPQPALINKDEDYIPYAEIKTANTLRALEERYDFNVWLLPCYSDDQSPNLWMTNKIKEWNAKWKYPHFAIMGNPDLPFNILREKFYDKIPVIKGDITGGWYQLHASIADFSNKKYLTDRLLPIAEKYSTIASISNKDYLYPKTQFKRAWNNLLFNDEHSYGASGYRGRKVHETWLQHSDWVNKSYDFSVKEIERSLKSICSKIKTVEPAVAVFNPTNQSFNINVKSNDGTKYKLVRLPKFGYKVINKSQFIDNEISLCDAKRAPVIENDFYKIEFAENGSIKSIFDKQLCAELLDKNGEYRCNEILFTKDDHKTFSVPEKASLKIRRDCDGITVLVTTNLTSLKAQIEQEITLCAIEKKITISNRILHAKEMYNLKDKQTYMRYIYISFPFLVENAKRLCHLNGTVMEYAKDVSGHCTDTYACMHDWCALESDKMSVALITKQPQLVEFDHIHPDKSDFGNAGKGSKIFCYVANDWLQMHVPGGNEINYQFDYAITSDCGKLNLDDIHAVSERFITPVHTVEIDNQNGKYCQTEKTFFDFNTRSRFLTLKPADDGDGIIARFYGQETESVIKNQIFEQVSIDELPTEKRLRNGFYTYRIKGYKAKELKEKKVLLSREKPLPVGSHYTGLIDIPKATNGENDGQIYLIWGANKEPNFSHYELYRSKTPNFKANKKTFVSLIYPEPFVIARYSDEGLENYTEYFYKVRAVNKQGAKSDFSPEFSAKTKQPL